MSDARFHMLILGDFGAREHRGAADVASLGDRRARRVDRDDVDDAIASFAPEVRLAIEPGTPAIAVRIKALDDFHPDNLVERVADFQRLRALRDEVADPRNARSVTTATPPARSASADAAAASLSDGSVLDMILAAEPTATPSSAAGPRDELADFVRNAVRPHVAPQPTADQKTLVANVDAVISATMRVVLHHPDFQAAEALWRGVAFLVRRLETGESFDVYLVDVTKSELREAVASPDGVAARALRRLLRGEATGNPGAWSLAVGLYSFGAQEVDLISSVAAVAQAAGVPWISAASAGLAGAASFAEGADPDDWDDSPLAGWDAFRRTPDAKWVGLAIPRILLRVPYGKRSDECSAIAFEETDDGQIAHAHYLWGSGALLPALLFGEAAADGNPPPTHGTVDGLPMFVESVDGLPAVKPCAEALLGQRAVSRLLDAGLTPLASERDGDSVRIPRLQSVAYPAAPLSAPVVSEEQ